MPDLLVRAIDERLAERIKRYAQERRVPLNQCMLELIDLGLKADARERAGQALENRDSILGAQEMRTIGGTWSGDEARAFQDALNAMKNIG